MTNARLQHPLFVIVGPSGSGKTRVSEAVFPKEAKIITHTTRPIRQEEQADVDYYFETAANFQELYETGQLVERDSYHGYQYGVGITDIIERTTTHPAYAVLTYNGLKKVYQRFPEDILVIFFDVSKEQVQQRLAQREDNEQLRLERLHLYDQEIKMREVLTHYPRCHVLDANQPFNHVVAQFKKIVQGYQ